MSAAARAFAPRAFVHAMLVVVLLSLAGEARADSQDAAATERFRRGAEAYRQHDYRAAALAFEAAHHIIPSAATLYNAALAWAQIAGEEIHAANDFDAALELGTLGDAQASDARRRLVQLDRSLARLEAVARPGTQISVDHADPVPAPAHLRAAAGAHELTATFPSGRVDRKRVTAERGVVTRVELEEPPAAEVDAAAPLPAHAPEDVRPHAERAAPQEQHGRAGLRTLGWVGVGVGAVLAGTAMYLGLTGLSARDDFAAGGNRDAALRDRAVSHRTWANAALIGAVVVAGTGAALLVVRF